MAYRFAIIDLTDYSVIKSFDEDNADVRTVLYELRKKRYQAEHPDRPTWEYDTIKHDNNYNLVKYTVIA